MLARGDRFAGYVVEEAIGHGGHATVYRVRRFAGPDAPVALKVLDDEHRQPAQLAKLKREFDFARQLDHPHVVTMCHSGPGWLSMELVDGGEVSALPAMRDRLAALTQIADALDCAHRLGIVHCDVKPSNILVSQNFYRSGAMLVDFGVAHAIAKNVLRRPTHIEASLPYSAPELLHGQAPSAASDEYALACTAVELITGSPPFTTTTAMDLISEHLRRPPPRISRRIAWVPHTVDVILAKAMAKNPDNRYESCTEFITLLTRAMQ